MKIRLLKLLIAFFVLLFGVPKNLMSQGKKEVVYLGAVSELNILEEYALPKFLYDSFPTVESFNEIISALQKDGYLLARLDSLTVEDEKVLVEIIPGDQFRWATLKPGNLHEGILSNIGYREKLYRKKPFRYEEVNKIFEKVIKYAENNGYPFASIQLDSISIQDQHVRAALNYRSGPFITFDTAKIEGTSRSKPVFISNYLRIKPGSPYEESKVEQASSRLRRLFYLKVVEAPYVTFQLKQGTPHFNLVDVKANQVDGIIGLMPNEGGGGRPLITGQFDLLLQNLLGTGKGISLNWQRTQVNSQNLDVKYNHPNLFKTPLNIAVGFSLLKEDTLFINRNFNLAASILVGKYSNLQAFTDIKTARTISSLDEANQNRFTQLADFDLVLYGLGYDFSNLNNLWVPTNGMTLEIEASVGNKKIDGTDRVNANVDSLDSKNVQYNVQLSVNKYFSVSKRFVIKSKLLAASVMSDQLFYNDLFRIGGLKTIRGFVENEFFVSDFAIGSLETQYLIDNESYMFLFYDQGYVYSNIDQKFEDYPGGIGAGLTFTTNAGTFSFVYAVGRTSSQSFNLNFSKIHFGYITRF